MTDKDKKGGIPHSDSGYQTSGGSPEQTAKLVAGVQQRDIRVFTAFIKKLTDFEFSSHILEEERSAKQMQELEAYLTANIGANNEDIQVELHFERVDLAIKESFPRTNLAGNEGAAFLTIARSCANPELLQRVIAIISIEKQEKAESEKLKEYLRSVRDKDQYNALHIAADTIVRKHDNGQLLKRAQSAYKYFFNLAPELEDQENKFGRKPKDIIIETIGIEPEEEVYQFDNVDEIDRLEKDCFHNFFTTSR